MRDSGLEVKFDPGLLNTFPSPEKLETEPGSDVLPHFRNLQCMRINRIYHGTMAYFDGYVAEPRRVSILAQISSIPARCSYISPYMTSALNHKSQQNGSP